MGSCTLHFGEDDVLQHKHFRTRSPIYWGHTWTYSRGLDSLDWRGLLSHESLGAHKTYFRRLTRTFWVYCWSRVRRESVCGLLLSVGRRQWDRQRHTTRARLDLVDSSRGETHYLTHGNTPLAGFTPTSIWYTTHFGSRTTNTSYNMINSVVLNHKALHPIHQDMWR